MTIVNEDYGTPPRAYHFEVLRPQGEYESDEFIQRTFNFDLSDVKLFNESGDVLEITDESRIRRSLELLANTCEGDYREVYEMYKNPKIREEQRTAHSNYLKKTVGKPPQVRRNYIDEPAATEIIYNDFKKINHPVYQLVSQITEEFSPEGENNQKIKRLKKDLAQTIAWDRYVQIYEQQIEENLSAQNS